MAAEARPSSQKGYRSSVEWSTSRPLTQPSGRQRQRGEAVKLDFAAVAWNPSSWRRRRLSLRRGAHDLVKNMGDLLVRCERDAGAHAWHLCFVDDDYGTRVGKRSA